MFHVLMALYFASRRHCACDKDYESFQLYKFDQGTQVWKLCGHSSVSRFGASAVVFKDKNEIFVAGGFKANIQTVK